MTGKSPMLSGGRQGPRDQPRAAAPILFGCFNIVCGLTSIGAAGYHVPAYAAAAKFLPLDSWAISFVALGAFIMLGPLHRRVAWVTSLTAVGWWFLWADFISQTVGPSVSPRAVATTVGIALLHILLMPYRRAKPRASCDGQ